MMQQQKIVVIGSGFSGLSAACFLAKAGAKVTVLEKHNQPGGRARQLSIDGFHFDMGPSWYWMPGVFERFFNAFGKTVSDYYELQRLDPSYRIYWQDEAKDIPADYNQLRALFEELEPGSGRMLDQYLVGAAYKYETGMNNLVYKPGRSLTEFADFSLMKGLLKLQVFTSAKKHIEKYFRHPRLQQILSFPLLFLGALPENTPALYSLMNYADIKLGTWYPMGGMHQVVRAMYDLAIELGVNFQFENDVEKFYFRKDSITDVLTSRSSYEADVVVASADYHFVEQQLLPEKFRSYTAEYWENRSMAPSCLIYFVGLNKKLEGLRHHSLFFDVPFDAHADEIYKSRRWPQQPLFYVSCPSQTDVSVAPEGCENLFILIPVATGLQDTEEIRERYFNLVMQRLEEKLGTSLRDHITVQRSYACTDFINDYNAFKGNAYGLANTLMQTAIMKPSLRSSKVENLFYAGQLTVPGPGVPPSIISGQLAAEQVMKFCSEQHKQKAFYEHH